jgi:parvulin-like peptidyl-prolyl isomerase
MAELRATIHEALGGVPSPEDDAEAKLPAELVAATLERAIDRRLVADRLVRVEKLKLSAEELAAVQRRFAASLTAQKSSLDQFKAQRGWSDEELTAYLMWQTLWSRYLRRELTDAALEKYFDAHRADFDGTQVRVSQLLLKVPSGADQSFVDKRLTEASAIRTQIATGKLSFADAVRQYSESPSRDLGGDQGFIPRRGVMVEPFSRAAFALQQGETSPPVVTQFGVHLIHCTQIKRGAGTWSLQRDELTRAMAAERFAAFAKAARSGAKIEYLAVPAPGTH